MPTYEPTFQVSNLAPCADPIYEAIDAQNWKQAVKHADAVLKKLPTWVIAKALKAYALAHMGGRDADATALCRECGESNVLDEHCLNILGLTLRRLGKGAVLTEIYERLVSRSPEDLQLQIGLFSCLVSEFSFLKQQQAAMKLSRMAPNDPVYLWWTALSMMLQARQGFHRPCCTRSPAATCCSPDRLGPSGRRPWQLSGPRRLGRTLAQSPREGCWTWP